MKKTHRIIRPRFDMHRRRHLSVVPLNWSRETGKENVSDLGFLLRLLLLLISLWTAEEFFYCPKILGESQEKGK